MYKLYDTFELMAIEVKRLIETKPELNYQEERILKTATEAVISYRRSIG